MADNDYFSHTGSDNSSPAEGIAAQDYDWLSASEGAADRPDQMQSRVIDPKVLAKERKKDFEISRLSRFKYRTRYFTDSGIIGSKEFVSTHYQRFKHLFQSKHEKKPKPIRGL